MSKYGRLFTEEDVLVLIERLEWALDPAPGGRTPKEWLSRLLGEHECEMTFPPDEPVFVLRAKDAAAAAPLAYYLDCLEDLPGHSPDHLEGAEEIRAHFIAWREEHPDSVRAPD